MTLSGEVVVRDEDLRQLCLQLLERAGVRPDVATDVAGALVQASLRGVDSHGVRLLPHYLRAVRAGRINPNPTMRFAATAAATGVLDADHTFGHAACATAMRHALGLAREAGIGAVAVRHSTHFGAAAYYALLAAAEGMIGIACTHADALMVSHGGRRPFFGANPVAFAAPCAGEDPVCLDSAPTATTWNRVLRLRESETRLPAGWAADSDGEPTDDPERAVALLPIGGHKGFGLAFMVEVLSSLLTGMPYGPHLTRMYADPIERKRLLGHFVLALRIDTFVGLEGFARRMAELVEELRREPARDPSVPVQAPGDPEKRIVAQRRQEGIAVGPAEWAALQELGEQYGVALPEGVGSR